MGEDVAFIDPDRAAEDGQVFRLLDVHNSVWRMVSTVVEISKVTSQKSSVQPSTCKATAMAVPSSLVQLPGAIFIRLEVR